VDQVERGVTHVVSAKDGTDKCIAARKTPGCVLVKAAWLVECYWSMTRRDTKLHLLGGEQQQPSQGDANKQQPPLRESKVENATIATTSSTVTGTTDISDVSSTGSEEDNDDFAASFEDEMMNS
jgi:RNA polymerase II subunit A-like phosphatase